MFNNLSYFSNLELLDLLTLSSIIFIIGVWGIVLIRKNIIIILISIELILLAVNFNFITFSVYGEHVQGQTLALFVLAVAAAESAIGLAILVSYFRVRHSINVDSVNILKH